MGISPSMGRRAGAVLAELSEDVCDSPLTAPRSPLKNSFPFSVFRFHLSPFSFPFESSHRAFKAYAQEFLCLYGKLHGELVDDVLGIAVDDEAYGIFR